MFWADRKSVRANSQGDLRTAPDGANSPLPGQLGHNNAESENCCVLKSRPVLIVTALPSLCSKTYADSQRYASPLALRAILSRSRLPVNTTSGAKDLW